MPATPTFKLFIQGFEYEPGQTEGCLKSSIPRGHTILLAGGPGTFKSSLCYNILYHNAKQGNKGLYLSFEQGRDGILRQMKKLGYNYGHVKEMLKVHDVGRWRELLEQRSKDGKSRIPSSAVFKEVIRIIQAVGANMIALDSLNSLYVLCDFENPRNDLYKFFKQLKEMEVSALFISEVRVSNPNLGVYEEDFMADGIIHTRMENIGGEMKHQVRCMKMREVEHDPNYYTLLPKEGGFDAVKSATED